MRGTGPSDVCQERDTAAHPLPSASTCSAEHRPFLGSADHKRFQALDVIGKGSYGVVCAAIDTLTGERVAIKKIQVELGVVAACNQTNRYVACRSSPPFAPP